jgi:hypothetical protein
MSARQRTDLEAIRIGVPAARRTRSSAFRRNAARSITAYGASRSAVRRAYRSKSPITGV